MICHLGTFDVENYGDLLYPLVFSHLLQTRDKTANVRRYSLLPGTAPLQAGFETHAARSLFEPLHTAADGLRNTEPQTIVIGGGDILRTDADLIARHYGRNSRASWRRLRQ